MDNSEAADLTLEILKSKNIESPFTRDEIMFLFNNKYNRASELENTERINH